MLIASKRAERSKGSDLAHLESFVYKGPRESGT